MDKTKVAIKLLAFARKFRDLAAIELCNFESEHNDLTEDMDELLCDILGLPMEAGDFPDEYNDVWETRYENEPDLIKHYKKLMEAVTFYEAQVSLKKNFA